VVRWDTRTGKTDYWKFAPDKDTKDFQSFWAPILEIEQELARLKAKDKK